MTGRKKTKVTKFYDRMTAQERVAMLFKLDVAGKEGDPEIKSTVPRAQVPEYNHLLGALNSIYTVIVPAAVELRHRAKILELLYVIAWTHIRWAHDRRMLISGEDRPSDFPVPGNPLGVIPFLTPENQLTPDSELAPLDQITRTNLDVIRGQLPIYVRERVAIEQVFDQLKVEIGVNESEEPTVRALLDDTVQMLETLEDASSWVLNFADDDSPEPHYLELLENAVSAARKESG